jgi:SAM-dependent methyltransferase
MTIKTTEEYTRANLEAWNEAAPRHAEHNNAALFEGFKDPMHIELEGDILALLKRVEIRGKSIVHLCCNNGRETLSLRNMGAGRCVGIDASESFLAHGREMIRIAGAEDQVELIQSDIYDLPEHLIGQFDIVLVTIGVLSWMPELKPVFEIIQSLLKPEGQLVMEDMHPILFMYDENLEGGPSSIQTSYFGKDIWEETTGLDYYGHEVYDSKPNYSFMHRLDEILMAGIDCGLQLRFSRSWTMIYLIFVVTLKIVPPSRRSAL